MDLTLINPPETDEEGNSRAYSIIAAPTEDKLAIATRLRDTAFKRCLSKTPPGGVLEMAGPTGDFTLHNKSERPAVFLAGGIGITPFFSIIKDATQQALPHKLYLFYSNRRPEDAAFLEEFGILYRQNPNFQFIPTMTALDKSAKPWEGETGYIDAEMIKRHLKAGGEPIFYLAGPPAFVVAMRQVLNAMEINDDDIRTEEFSGY